MRLKTPLLKHQVAAVEKLRKIKVGALFMEQGTGKTRTTLELIKRRLDAGKVDKVLWLSPCSVKKNLMNDIKKHIGEIPGVFTISGIESLSNSAKLYNQLMELVKSYDCYLIVDESSLVKNIKAKRTQRIIELAERCKYKLILNGTPITKTEADLFAQWYILDWRILGYRSFHAFEANHIEYRSIRMPNGNERIDKTRIRRILNTDYLAEKIEPYTYQVKKKDCIRLPKKLYNYKPYELSVPQRYRYTKIKQEYLAEVDEIKSSTIYKLFTALQHIASGRDVITSPDDRMRTEELYVDALTNPRIKALAEILKEVGSEKCIIFAKYKSEIGDIAILLKSLDKSYALFTGDVNVKERDDNKERFEASAQFLLANKNCGAFGLNLQFCRNIIYYSNDFDYGTRVQSEDRVHRIGQNQNVRIFDLVASGTIDELIMRCLNRKQNILDAFKRELELRRGYHMNGIIYTVTSPDSNIDFYNKIGPALASRSVRKELGGYAIDIEPHWNCIFAEKNDVLVGFMVLEPKKSSFEIQSGYVFEEYRKQGIATEMLKLAIKLANEEGKTITAMVPKEVTKIFTKNEFVITSETNNWGRCIFYAEDLHEPKCV